MMAGDLLPQGIAGIRIPIRAAQAVAYRGYRGFRRTIRILVPV
jgi:hypothetical protein